MADFFCTGQDCTAGSRVYVQDSVYDKFLELLLSRVRETKMGDAFDDTVAGGPVVSCQIIPLQHP